MISAQRFRSWTEYIYSQRSANRVVTIRTSTNCIWRKFLHLPRTFIPAVGTAPYTAGNGALNDRKRRFTALIFTLFHRNPSVRIMTAVSGRFLLRNDHRFTPFLYTYLDWRITTAVSGRFSPVYSRFRPFTRRSVGPGMRSPGNSN
jgi:hypothetical protein